MYSERFCVNARHEMAPTWITIRQQYSIPWNENKSRKCTLAVVTAQTFTSLLKYIFTLDKCTLNGWIICTFPFLYTLLAAQGDSQFQERSWNDLVPVLKLCRSSMKR